MEVPAVSSGPVAASSRCPPSPVCFADSGVLGAIGRRRRSRLLFDGCVSRCTPNALSEILIIARVTPTSLTFEQERAS